MKHDVDGFVTDAFIERFLEPFPVVLLRLERVLQTVDLAQQRLRR